MKNNTAGVREREDANRTREAGNGDEVEGVVANTLNLFRDGAVGFIEWLDVIPLHRFRPGVPCLIHAELPSAWKG